MERNIIYCDGSLKHLSIWYEGQSIILPRKGTGSHNEAEYEALIAALAWLAQHQETESVVIFSDSQLAIRQIKGIYTTRNDRLSKLQDELLELVWTVFNDKVEFGWCARELNKAGIALEKYEKGKR